MKKLDTMQPDQQLSYLMSFYDEFETWKKEK